MPEFSYIGTAVLIAKALHALDGAVSDGLDDLKTSAIAKTPQLSGGLRGDYEIDGPHTSTAGVEGKVSTSMTGEGGPAIFVHQRTRLHHDTGQAKFLTAAVREQRRNLRAKVAAAAKRAF